MNTSIIIKFLHDYIYTENIVHSVSYDIIRIIYNYLNNCDKYNIIMFIALLYFS